MKIIFANNYFYLRGGSERVFFDEIAWLEREGHEIIPFSRSHPQNHDSLYSNFFVSVPDFQRLSPFEKAKSAVNIVYSRKNRKSFAALLGQTQPDLIHGHNIYGGLTYSIVDAARARRVPFVLTLHDLKLACPSYLMLNRGRLCERCGRGAFVHCFRQACHKNSPAASMVNTVEAYFNTLFGKYDWVGRFICPSRFLLEKVAAVGIPREKLTYLANALDVRAYQANFTPGNYVLYVGRLSPEKGVLTLLRACRQAGVPLKVAGTGPLEGECKAFAEEQNLRQVTFAGFCQGEQLRELFQRAALVVIPSEWYENAPMSVLEAFAYGKPVIGSRLGGIPELVRPGETGLLFEAGNADELALRIAELWGEPSQIETMGRQARCLVETDFSADLHLDRLARIYAEARRSAAHSARPAKYES